MRETFFCNQMSYNNQVEYSKHGDFLINHEIAFKIGGKTKDGKQIAKIENSYIAADNIDYPMGNKIPLWLFGLMY